MLVFVPGHAPSDDWVLELLEVTAWTRVLL